MLEKPRKLRVFLCHTSADKPKVLEVYKRLVAEDWIDPWLDKAKILPGQDWELVIEKAVDDSDVVIACLSSQSVTKEGFVQREIRYAYDMALEKPEETIFLIPLRLDECNVPRKLRTLHWVDYFGADKENSYPDLLEALKLRYEQKLRLEAEEFERKQIEQKVQLEAEVLARKLAEEQSAREKAVKKEKEKAERESAETAAREKEQLKTEERARRKVTQEKVEREVAKTKKSVPPIEKPIVQVDQRLNKSGFSFIVASVLVLMTIFIYLGWHRQSLPSVPVATPTLNPPELFVSPLPSVENSIAMTEEFAKQTATANSNTPRTPTYASVVSPAPTTSSALIATAVPAGVRPATYTLQNGEFTYCIARRFNVDPDALLRASGMTSPDLYYPGLTLTIPQNGAFPGSRMLASHPTTYSVLSSDETAYSVACKFGDVDPAAIANINHISVSAKLTAGQKLQIP